MKLSICFQIDDMREGARNVLFDTSTRAQIGEGGSRAWPRVSPRRTSAEVTMLDGLRFAQRWSRLRNRGTPGPIAGDVQIQLLSCPPVFGKLGVEVLPTRSNQESCANS